MPINNTYDYGCLMVDLKINNWTELQQKLIDTKDIYYDKYGEFGLEDTPHITILYGLHDNTDIEALKKLTIPIGDIYIEIGNIDIFETDNFDVVKFNIESDQLNELNVILRDNFDYTTEYNDYKPHMTISYVKPGRGKTYKRELNKIKMRPYRYRYTSSADEVITWTN